MNNLPTPGGNVDPDIVSDVEALLRKFGGDDLSQQDAARALGMWKHKASLSAGERAAVLACFKPDPDQARIVNLLGSLQNVGGVS